MSRRARAGTAVSALLVALTLLLAGCVSVPTSGSVEKVPGAQPACQGCVNIVVAPPTAGDDPRQIVEGYLRATSNYQPNYSVAKQFLTRSAVEKWSPEAGASIYTGAPLAAGNKVTFSGRLVGSLGADRTYTARDQPLKLDFGMVQQDGEWRIDSPPPGLMVAQYSFTSFYEPFDLYFLGHGTLVPDPIYLATSAGNPASVASSLMKALLAGPSSWLKPSVTTEVPPGTTLSVDSVTITNGVAEVPLSDTVMDLTDEQRSLLAAQVVSTLKQVTSVVGVKFTVKQQPFRVPEADPGSLVVGVDTIPRELDPVPDVSGDTLYAVRKGAAQVVNATGASPTLRRVAGPLGDGRYDVGSLAVSVSNTDLALVTDGRTKLRRSPTSSVNGAPDVSTVLSGVTGLLRPQFSRFGEIWAVGQRDGRQRIWRVEGQKVTEVDSHTLGRAPITAFKLSPDGTRMALIRQGPSGPQLGLARITRSDKIVVDGWRVLNTTQDGAPLVRRMADVGWLDATTLLVLGAASKDAALAPIRVSEDASSIKPETQPSTPNAVELTVLPRTGTAIVVDRSGQTFRDDGNVWQPFVDGVSSIAYPG
ncbi:MAG: lpqB [Friedmanniella sp.]|nr:lpqB [Friedmanniella sp.]